MQVDNLKLVQKLAALKQAAAAQNNVSVAVGYNGEHALALHEMTPKHKGMKRPSGLGVRWGPSLYGNQFLLGPAREFREEVADDVLKVYQRTHDLLKGLTIGGLRIQRESMQRCLWSTATCGGAPSSSWNHGRANGCCSQKYPTRYGWLSSAAW